MILPNITSTGLIGIDSRLSIVPRSTSRVTESAVKISMVMVRMVPTRPGTMLRLDAAAGRGGGLVGARRGDLDRPLRRIPEEKIVLECALHTLAEGADPRARRH